VKRPFETKPGRRRSPLKRGLKALEQLLKRSLLAVLTRVAAPRSPRGPDWEGPNLRVLFLRHDRIGDMILTTAVIRAIAQSHPNIELDVLASPGNAGVVEKNPLVHRVVRFDVHRLGEWPKLWKYLRQERYDIVVDCMVFSQSLTTMLLMLATGAPHRVGVVKPGKPHVYTMFAEPAGLSAHHVEHLAQLAVPFGVAAQDALELGIVLTEAERTAALTQWGTANPRVVVNISVGKAFRQWADDNFIAATKHLKARLPGARVLVLHAPAERQRAQAIADAAGVARANTPGVRNALAMVATADLVFTPDTSILHAASAFKIPTAALVTADHVVRWGLYRTVGEIVASMGDTLADVPLEKAIQAIDKLLLMTRHPNPDADFSSADGSASISPRRASI
jgi:ADP-heptose:LPS heptosyltransferase